jgi:uncharacterized membrane protein
MIALMGYRVWVLSVVAGVVVAQVGRRTGILWSNNHYAPSLISSPVDSAHGATQALPENR